MNFFVRHIQNEDGLVLILALFVLILLTIVGIAATNTSTIDLQIAANDKASKIAFYHADAGVYATPKLISATIDAGATVTGSSKGNFNYLTSGTLFFNQLMGYDTYDGGTKDVEFTIGSNTVQVDVEMISKEALAGGSAEFAAGAEGTGAGGSMIMLFEMNAQGTGPTNSVANIVGRYRKVVGVPGGL